MHPVEVISRSFAELTTAELHDVLRLRCDVFVVEQVCVYPDIDGRDTESMTLHHWIARDRSIAAYARTLADPDGATRVGRVVTAPRFRGEGLAALMITTIIETNPGPLVLDAQSYLTSWYERMGFESTGPEFIEDGIAHVPMALTARR